jgi:spermidine dehydrogenase
MRDPKDRDLGLGRAIPRRDFLNGVALTGLSTLLPPRALFGAEGSEFAPEKAAGYYPPALTGLRGSHEGSFEAAHALREGARRLEGAADTGETFDLVVVGAGISGLSAAHYFRRGAGSASSVLLLDNHDDFGGHARRNEFQAGGRLLVSYGGTFSIDSPAPYSPVAAELVRELGIDVSRWKKVLDPSVYEGLETGTFFDRETFGRDVLVKGLAGRRGNRAGRPGPDDAALAAAPLDEAARRDVARLEGEDFDPWPGLASAAKKDRLLRMSYEAFLRDAWKVGPGGRRFYQRRPHGLFGVGIDAVCALDAWGLGLPGFQGLKLEPGFVRGMNRDSMRTPEADEYYFHFPDGNATIARLLLRRLIPEAVPGSGTDEVVLARADYARLDEAGRPVRLRLNSTVLSVRHAGDPGTAKEVEVVYARGGRLHKVRARAAVLACWHTVIPYLCPEMPPAQKEALAFAVKVPLVYTNVVVREWTSFRKLGLREVAFPGGSWDALNLDYPVDVGGYRCPREPGEPIVVNLARVPCAPGLAARDQHRAGRQELLATPFVDMERSLRDLMGRTLGPGGFDPARDILAITVNRWPHGYAYQYNALFDRFWVDGMRAPCELARQRFGRIALANADADAYSYTDAAIDQAHRAVRELVSLA